MSRKCYTCDVTHTFHVTPVTLLTHLQVSLYAAFLPPSGVLQHFFIPFHSLSTSKYDTQHSTIR